MHIISVDQFTKDFINELFARTDYFKGHSTTSKEIFDHYNNKQLCTLFYSPSTRTRLSFETAALKLGMGVVSTENAGEFSSAAKGETIEDTVKVLNEYGYEAIVIRHSTQGELAKAAAVSKTPIINAGDGSGEHPTQALLDMYTINSKQGRLDNLHVVLGGDLKAGRTVRSLAKLLALYKNNHITFVSIPELQIGQDIRSFLEKHNTTFDQTNDMSGALKKADVVYWTRLQKERHNGSEVKDNFIIDEAALKLMNKQAIIMHPLPRVGEITTAVDTDSRAVYFEQAGNGLYVRMALIDCITR